MSDIKSISGGKWQVAAERSCMTKNTGTKMKRCLGNAISDTGKEMSAGENARTGLWQENGG